MNIDDRRNGLIDHTRQDKVELAFVIARCRVGDVGDDAILVIEIGKPGSGYILSSACSVAPHVKPERLKRLAQLAEELGQY